MSQLSEETISNGELLSIKIKIGERFYPLKVKYGQEEEIIRRAAKFINDKIIQYKHKFINSDIQDYLAMVALQSAKQVIELEEQLENLPIIDSLKEIENELNEYIENLY